MVQVDLAEHFIRRLFTNSLDNPNHAEINDWLYEYVMNRSIPEDKCLTYKEIRFWVRIFDSNYEFDCLSCANQEINVPSGNYSNLLLVTTAQFARKMTVITAVYEDGSSENCDFSVGDWCDKIPRDEYVIHYAAACRTLGWNSKLIKGDAYIYLQRVRINAEKTLRKLILPDEQDIFIFAGGLC